jgi:hypothetical protein
MNDSTTDKTPQDFIPSSYAARASMPGEFWRFLKHSKKWWLLPVLLGLCLLALLVLLSGTAVAPFLYPLF